MTTFDLPITIIYVHDIRLMPESGASAFASAVSNPLDTRDSREVCMA